MALARAHVHCANALRGGGLGPVLEFSSPLQNRCCRRYHYASKFYIGGEYELMFNLSRRKDLGGCSFV